MDRKGGFRPPFVQRIPHHKHLAKSRGELCRLTAGMPFLDEYIPLGMEFSKNSAFLVNLINDIML